MSRLILIISCFFLFACDNHKDIKNKTADIDSIYFKDFKYIKLNDFVGYHIIKEGKRQDDTGVIYELKPIGIYRYFDKKYEPIKHPEIIPLRSVDMKTIFLSDTFSYRLGFEGVFKVNSQIEFIYKPYILKRFSVLPKKKSASDIRVLMLRLKKENFVGSISIDTMKPSFVDTMINHKKRTVFINVHLKAAYWTFNKLDSICNELNKWPEVDQAVDVKMFNGKSEYNIFYSVTSKIGKIADYKKKDSVSHQTNLEKLIQKYDK